MKGAMPGKNAMRRYSFFSGESTGRGDILMKMNLGEIERVRLILRGGAVIDWRRLNVSSTDECNAILRANEIYPDDPGDAARLAKIRQSAVDYLGRNFGFIFAPEIVNAGRTSDLMLLAAGQDPLLQPQACMILKLMHVIHHVDARELRSKLAVPDRELYRLVEEKAMSVARDLEDLGFPVIEFTSSHKSPDALITKLIGKKQTIRALVFDRIRFRIVTKTIKDIISVVAYLNQHLFPFNYTVPGESRNTLFDFPDFVRNDPVISPLISNFQINLELEDEMRPLADANTCDTFRTVKFVVDLPIRVDEQRLRSWAPGGEVSPGIIYILSEFQIVDQATHINNQCGNASHEKYEARRLEKVRQRLIRGRMIWKGKDSL
jgi:uncharacterized protein (TIGR04552 family)